MKVSQPKYSIRAYRIYDMPGYKWELNWYDGDEEWSIEVQTDDELLEDIRYILRTGFLGRPSVREHK